MCDAFGADIADLTHVLGADPRIGPDFLRPGSGWAGPCLPKGTRALLHQSWHAGIDFSVLSAAIVSNTHYRDRVVTRLRRELGGRLDRTRIGVVGPTFKAGTNDLRESPAVRIARDLAASGTIVTAHDPTLTRGQDVPGLTVAPQVYYAAVNADALVLLTDWPGYQSLDWTRIATAMAGDLVLDTRATLDHTRLATAVRRSSQSSRGLPEAALGITYRLHGARPAV